MQTERRPLYKEYADLLIEKGHAYRCFCEKTESEEDSGDFDRADDPTAPEIQKALREQGVEYVMQRYMSLQPDEPLYGMILKAWQA